MAIASEGTATSDFVSIASPETDPTHAHTTSANTSIMLAALTCRAEDESVVTDIKFDGVSMTLVAESISSGLAGDMYAAVYGVVSPGVKSGADLLVDTTSNLTGAAIAAWNYSGTVTSSVADATNVLETDEDDSSATNLKAFSSQGTSGYTMVGGFGIRGTNDQDPISVDNGFSDVIEPGAGEPAEAGAPVMLIADKIGGAPSAVTFTGSGSTDEWAAFLIELVPAGGTSDVNFSSSNRGIMRGVGRGVG